MLEEIKGIGELKKLADTIEGFSYASNIGEATLRTKLGDFIIENPGCLGNDDESGSMAEGSKDSGVDNSEELAKIEADKIEADKKIAEAKKLADGGIIKMESKTPGIKNTSEGQIEFKEENGKFVAEVTEDQATLLESIKGYSRC